MPYSSILANKNQSEKDSLQNDRQPQFKPFFQPKLPINQPNDIYEQEADAMADKVMRMTSPPQTFFKPSYANIQRKCAQCEEDDKNVQRKEAGNGSGKTETSTENYISSLRGRGSALTQNEKSFFEPRFGSDFSNVRVHVNDAANQSAKSIQALAYTHGDHIVFGANQYQPNTERGKKLMAHELTHTIQQKQIPDQQAQRFLQRTAVGSILDEFFSPFSDETLWNMSETDNYSVRVRAWQPVIEALNLIKQDIAADCVTWSATHRTTPGWSPGMNAIPDTNAYRTLVAHPTGTEPEICRNAFIIFQGSRALPPHVATQTNDLYTCSIGSFSLAVTVNSIDCTTHTADINVWMYNIMSEGSFGKFAQYFPVSGMENQYMWWNWDETIRWAGSGGVTTVPERRTGEW